VAAASTAASICDTNALLDYLAKDAPDHVRFRHVIDRARTRYVPGLVLADVVVLAEDLGIRRLAMRDVRDFAAVRLRDGSAFELAVHICDPDR
jgi:predicted nucleic acid-binding protein